MLKLLFIICASLLFPDASAASSARHHCRCLPHQACWPSVERWVAFNTSVSGSLIALKPVGSACHDPNFDSYICEQLKASMMNSTWRASQPGAVQWVNWESRPKTNESCEIGENREIPCHQGKISLYSLIAYSEDQIRKAVRFAQERNIRLVIRNTGHDFAGRSTAPESLQIFTHLLKDVVFTENFIPYGSPGDQEGQGPAVTIGAGVQLAELYKELGAKGQMAVAGSAHGVGAAGGYVQGGGHSILGPWKGMASDNVLQFRVILASGQIVVANKHKNQDLFWALRGGGGGTFGVVIDVTLRTFPDVPIATARINVKRDVPDEIYWGIVNSSLGFLPIISGHGRSGSFTGTPRAPVSDGSSTTANLFLKFNFVNETSTENIKRLLAPLTHQLGKISGAPIEANITRHDSISGFYESDLGSFDITGAGTFLVSRLISKRFLESHGGPKKLSDAITSLGYNNSDTFSVNFVAGDQVARNSAVIDSALNPAWRKSLIHLFLTRGWYGHKGFNEQKEIQDDITSRQGPILKSLEPGRMGAYLNEANSQEPNFQHEFWGKNYRRLHAIKRRYDPFDLFITRLGVGSEYWDDEGLCRVSGR
ncbi:hypothetical protein AJ78_02985 [Emergomyces pasteurianus Ep9510]|uniref:FAD-binding PCMH-type domain-containing protein n=1 Tax=Emergomyces pasteurianus Ep9510 TaxID=1447872 RepID=A0A1J9QL25_9EURO|nr:hypothetical protein AJ78_02985 [Emergomyces pasteurianus Ep9510]